MPPSSAPAAPPLPYTPGYPIRTERLDLRPVLHDDFAAIHAYQRRPEVCRYLYWGPFDEAGSRASVDAKTTRTTLREDGDVLQLAVVVRETGTLVGDVTFFWKSRAHRQGGIGYVFHPDHAGHGYATEASRALLELGFEELHSTASRPSWTGATPPRPGCWNGWGCAGRAICGRTSSSTASGATRSSTRCWRASGGRSRRSRSGQE